MGALVSLAILMTGGLVFYLSRPQARCVAPVKLRLALPLQPQSALLLVATHEGFFEDNGILVTTTRHPSGKRALNDGLFSGNADVAGASDVPIAIAGLERSDFRVIACTFVADNVNRIIARTDAGIRHPKDLRGKRIATQRGSAVHYFLYLFLLEHGISEDDVSLSFMVAEALPEALAKGEIDAFSMREPYISQAKRMLGDKAVLFAVQGIYQQMDVVVVSDRVASLENDPAKRIINALIQAEEFVRTHPLKARLIVASMLDTEPESLLPVWNSSQIRVSMPQMLIYRLEDEARWIIRQEKESFEKVPNYLDVIMDQPLKSTRPESATIK